MCPAGYFTDNTDHLGSCKSCPIGFFKETVPRVSCEACPSGKVGILTTGIVPDAGQYNAWFYSGNKTCMFCVKGRYSEAEGIATPTLPAKACKECSRGKWSEKEGASSAEDCKSCGLGKYSSLPAQTEETACIACLPGLR